MWTLTLKLPIDSDETNVGTSRKMSVLSSKKKHARLFLTNIEEKH